MKRTESRTSTRRAVLSLGLGAGLACIGARAQTAKPLPARIGYNGDFNGASMVAVANKLNLWAKHGIAAEPKVFTNGPLQVQALGTKDLDFGYIGPGALWLPMSGRAKVIAINNLGFSDRVIAQPGIASIKELKGKTVAVPEGTTGDMLLRLALQKTGMSLDDVKRVAMDPSTIVTAFASGQVDAAGIWYPLVGTIKSRVPKLQELFSNNELYPTYCFPTSFVSRSDLADSNPALVEAMIRVIKEANDFRVKNLKQAVELTAKLLDAPLPALESEAAVTKHFSTDELVKLTRDGTVNRWFTGMNELFKSLGRVPDNVSPDKYFLAAKYAETKV
ncbi:MAG TPA: aliphatic sulfonate ABC transporter substrate-binding protein [Burkholderiaceae bacterium]|nr:aliphatic sulfonate ABC transporter substrate-binding protein [Burkholderiaceae bacterium]